MRKSWIALTMLGMALTLGACDDDSELEDRMEEVGDEIEDATDELD